MQINKPDNTLQNISVGSKEINAARVAFFLPGFVISTWAPMIPMVKARLKLEADVLGLLLLCIGISAFIFMPLAGALVQRFGCKKVVITGATLMALISVLLSCLPNIWSYAIALAFSGQLWAQRMSAWTPMPLLWKSLPVADYSAVCMPFGVSAALPAQVFSAFWHLQAQT